MMKIGTRAKLLVKRDVCLDDDTITPFAAGTPLTVCGHTDMLGDDSIIVLADGRDERDWFVVAENEIELI